MAATSSHMEIAGSVVFSVALVFVFLHYSKQQRAEFDNSYSLEEASEACLYYYDEEPLCGAMSFDSTGEFACVETYVDGQLKWACQ